MHQHSLHKGGPFPASLRYATRGLRLAWRDEKNLRRQAVLLVAAGLIGGLVRLSAVEWVIITLTAGLVLASELGNSALEALSDVIHPSYSPGIQRAKDMAAAAVLVMSLVALVVGFLILVIPFVQLLVSYL